MPSSAFQKFECNLLVDVDRIIKSHTQLNHVGGGRRGLGHITRSGILILCAAWELYLEEVCVESVKKFIERNDSPKDLPKPVKKEISISVKQSRHELKPLELAGEGWKDLYLSHATLLANKLNTPKAEPVNKLFKKTIGLNHLSDSWSAGSQAIDNFVSARGEIAHRGRDSRYITIGKLKEYRQLVTKTVLESDNSLADYIQNNTPGNKTPWRRRDINKIP